MSEETVTAGAEHSENAGVGPLLRASRQRVGEELRDVAEMLRIRYPYLEAIEEGRFKDLPGQTYAVGFVRAYAEHLGLDSEEVVRRFKIEVEAGGARHDLHFPTPVAETGFPGGAIVFVGLVVAVLAYGGWYLSTTKDGFFSDLVAPLPERLAALVDGGDEAAKPAETAVGSVENEEAATPPPEPKPAPENESADKPAAEPGAESDAAQPAETASPAPETGAQEQDAAARAEAAAAEAARAEAEAAAAKAREAAEEAAKNAAAEKAAQEAAEKAAQEAAEKAAQEAAEKAADLAKAEAEAKAKAKAQAASEAAALAQTQAAAPPPAPPAPVAEATAPAETASTEAPQPAPAAEEPVTRIIVHATANSWIEVRDDFSNTMLVSRLLKAGERYAVPDKTGLSLHTGNAGALEILVDGAVVPAIGAGGAVLRGVQLDPDLLKSGTAAQ